MTIKCIVIDDELIARDLLSEYISRVPELELAGSYANALEATDIIRKEKIDLLFLDIQMPTISGFDFIKSLNPRPQFILTTAYTEYAVKSYEFGATDYLVKPIEFERFYRAVNKAIAVILPHAQLIKTTEPDRSKVDHLFIKTSNKVVKVSHDEIQYITSMGAYVRIVTTAGEEVLSLQSMKRMEEVLPGDQFFRVHRSHIINIKHVNSIEGNIIRLDQDNTITLSKSKREDFLRRIDHNNLLYQ